MRSSLIRKHVAIIAAILLTANLCLAVEQQVNLGEARQGFLTRAFNCMTSVAEYTRTFVNGAVPNKLLCMLRENIGEATGGTVGSILGNLATTELAKGSMKVSGWAGSVYTSVKVFQVSGKWLDKTQLSTCTKFAVRAVGTGVTYYALCYISEEAAEYVAPLVGEYIGGYAGMLAGGFFAIKLLGSDESLLYAGENESYTKKCIRCSVGDQIINRSVLRLIRPVGGLSGFLVDQAIGSLFFNATDLIEFARSWSQKTVFDEAIPARNPVTALLGEETKNFYATQLAGLLENIGSFSDLLQPQDQQTFKRYADKILSEADQLLAVAVTENFGTLGEVKNLQTLSLEALQEVIEKSAIKSMKAAYSSFKQEGSVDLWDSIGLPFVESFESESGKIPAKVLKHWITSKKNMEYIASEVGEQIRPASIRSMRTTLFNGFRKLEKAALGFPVTLNEEDLNPLVYRIVVNTPFVLKSVLVNGLTDREYSKADSRKFYRTLNNTLFDHYKVAAPSVFNSRIFSGLRSQLGDQIMGNEQ